VSKSVFANDKLTIAAAKFNSINYWWFKVWNSWAYWSSQYWLYRLRLVKCCCYCFKKKWV